MHHQQLSLQSQMIAASALAELADEVKATPWPMFTRAKILDMIAAVRSNWAEPRVIEMSDLWDREIDEVVDGVLRDVEGNSPSCSPQGPVS